MRETMQTLKTPIQEWFDPKLDSHIIAYEEFQRSGAWPRFFVPLDVEVPHDNGRELVTQKIAMCYVSQRLEQIAKKASQPIPRRMPEPLPFGGQDLPYR